MTAYDLVWRWRSRPTDSPRFGQRCRVLARGRMNNCMVEFDDGYRVVTSRWAVRKAEPVNMRAASPSNHL